MNKSRELVEMGNFYAEKVAAPIKDTFEVAKGVAKNAKAKKPFVGAPTGPEASHGFNKQAITDPATTKNKETFQDVKKFSAEKYHEKVGKSEVKDINNCMSNIFDKLFEDVMGLSQDDQDAQDLGLPGAVSKAAPMDALTSGDEETVTITLDKALAQKLHDVLMTAMGGEESKDAEGEAEGETEGETEGEGEGEGAEDSETVAVAGEATEMTELKPSAGQALQGKGNKVGGTVDSLVAKGGGDGKIKGEVDGKGKDEGHALVGGGVKGGAPTSPKGKANVVAGKASNVGQYLFQK